MQDRRLGDRASSIDDVRPDLANLVASKKASKQSLLLPDISSRQGAKESDLLAKASIMSRSDEASPRLDRNSSLKEGLGKI